MYGFKWPNMPKTLESEKVLIFITSFFRTGSCAKLFIPDAKNRYATKGNTNKIVRTKYFFK